MSRAAGYVRVSTEEQAREGISLDAQRRQVAERAEAEEFDLVEVYADEGISGSRSDRPGYQAMLAAASAGEFERLLVWKFDRLGRDAEELLRARRMLEAAGVSLVSLTEGEAESTLVYGVRALVAQEEREKIAERTRMGLAEIARSGRQPCGQPPLGYRAVGVKRERRWARHDAEAEIVLRIFGEYLSGVGTNTITSRLNADGVRTRRGARFSARVVIDVLANPTYAGKIRLKGEVFDADHEPLVDAETWARVQELRAARREAAGRGRGRHPIGRHLFVKGLLRCGTCGSAMTPLTSAKGHEHYRCVKARTYGDCSMPSIARWRVDEPFLTEVFERRVFDAVATAREIGEEAARRAASALALAEHAEHEAAEGDAALTRIRADYQRGALTAEEWRGFKDEIEASRNASLAEADQHRSQAEAISAEAECLDADAELTRRMGELREAIAGRIATAERGSVDAVRAALTAAFERVELTVGDPQEHWERLRDTGPGFLYSQPHGQPQAVFLVPHVRADGIRVPVRFQAEVSEPNERVRSGIRAAELEWPGGRLTVNLAPAALRKEGSGFDFPIALAVLAASRQIPAARLAGHASLGELALDGRVRAVGGTLAAAEGARRSGFSRLLCAAESAPEAALAGVEPVPVRHLAQAVAYLRGERDPPPFVPAATNGRPKLAVPDLADVRGQERARRALEIAAAGGHNLLLAGPPGTGKTMLARRLAGILPPLGEQEALEVTRIHSVAGLLEPGAPLVSAPPFRAPHHSASTAAIVGGGPGPRPGEASLAHRGVLLLDELPEFVRPALEALRQPLEDGVVSVARARGQALFPARFQLVATMNLCPCGARGDPVASCSCSAPRLSSYLSKAN